MLVYIGTHPKELLKGWAGQHNLCVACSRASAAQPQQKNNNNKEICMLYPILYIQ